MRWIYVLDAAAGRQQVAPENNESTRTLLYHRTTGAGAWKQDASTLEELCAV